MKAINVIPLYDLVVLKENLKQDISEMEKKLRNNDEKRDSDELKKLAEKIKWRKEDLSTLKQSMNPKKLILSSMKFYSAVKAYGIENMKVSIKNAQGEIKIRGIDLPAKVRAMAEYIFILMSRSNELDKPNTMPTRLDRHYGLKAPLEDVLGTKMIKRSNSDLDIISIQDVIDMWFEA